MPTNPKKAASKGASKGADKNADKDEIKSGVVHRVPKDLKDALLKNSDVLKLWNMITPLARNEWICYITIVKTAKTREEHIVRMREDLRNGKRRPCCWPGCPHRRPSAAKWFK